uniref:Uncharacterized protein n=1 Tax=Lactuca sativa TaxID=4236 RepID=A0A9R1XH91_LACSA|nr:hypothetical protein LSAT_V11C400211090 [Lactuca sativa]
MKSELELNWNDLSRCSWWSMLKVKIGVIGLTCERYKNRSSSRVETEIIDRVDLIQNSYCEPVLGTMGLIGIKIFVFVGESLESGRFAMFAFTGHSGIIANGLTHELQNSDQNWNEMLYGVAFVTM